MLLSISPFIYINRNCFNFYTLTIQKLVPTWFILQSPFQILQLFKSICYISCIHFSNSDLIKVIKSTPLLTILLIQYFNMLVNLFLKEDVYTKVGFFGLCSKIQIIPIKQEKNCHYKFLLSYVNRDLALSWNPNNACNSANSFYFAITNLNPLNFQKYLLHSLLRFHFNSNFTKDIKPITYKTIPLIQYFYWNQKYTRCDLTSCRRKFRWLHLPHKDSNKDFVICQAPPRNFLVSKEK